MEKFIFVQVDQNFLVFLLHHLIGGLRWGTFTYKTYTYFYFYTRKFFLLSYIDRT